MNIRFALSFEGNDADDNLLDFYDAADALTGFQRTLALTTHLVLNGEIITQAPSLSGARIMIKSPEEGSWKVVATVGLMMGSGIYTIGTAPRDTALGHLVASVYDYVVKESLGYHVDFDQTLGQQYDEEQSRRTQKVPSLSPSQLDSLIEKTESSIKEMHRPIYASKSAETAQLSSIVGRTTSPISVLSRDTFDYVNFTTQIEKPVEFSGRVSSYNINTYKGRMYVLDEHRPVPFEIAESARHVSAVALLTGSLDANARDRGTGDGLVKVTALRFESNTGRLKRLLVIGVRA